MIFKVLTENEYKLIYKLLFLYVFNFSPLLRFYYKKWLVLEHGDWGLGIGDWAQSPMPNPQSPIPIYSEHIVISSCSNKYFLFI